MKQYLAKSISSINQNKLNGILAEIDLRAALIRLGFEGRISQGGWIARNDGANVFGHHSVIFFPMIIEPDTDYDILNKPPQIPRGLHTICSTMHQIGIHSYYCIPGTLINNDPNSVVWYATQLGIPEEDSYHSFEDLFNNFNKRERRYNFLRYASESNLIPEHAIAEQFTKENIRVCFQNLFMSEMSDVDGILWGQEKTYPLEIKEKTVGHSRKVGDFFGIDVGPFVKLAFYAAKRGNLHSLFIVKEIDNITDRNLVNWWFITFDKLAQYASWVPIGGGTNMQGGGSSTIIIPKSEFMPLDASHLNQL
jgi:hypothetical protein